MSKFFSIVLSALLFFQSLGISVKDIVELDQVVEHAKYHSDRYGDNFFVFMSKHYGELKTSHTKEHQEERQQHEKLPFQNHCPTSTISAFVLNTHIQSPSFQELDGKTARCFFYQDTYHSWKPEGEFQPPKQA